MLVCNALKIWALPWPASVAIERLLLGSQPSTNHREQPSGRRQARESSALPQQAAVSRWFPRPRRSRLKGRSHRRAMEEKMGQTVHFMKNRQLKPRQAPRHRRRRCCQASSGDPATELPARCHCCRRRPSATQTTRTRLASEFVGSAKQIVGFREGHGRGPW